MSNTKTKNWNGLPPQRVSSKIKNSPKHQKETIRSIVRMANSDDGGARASRSEKQINYDVVNSRFKTTDFKHVLNPYGATDVRFTNNNVKMQSYNILRSKLESLKGEEMKMGLNFRAVATNGSAVNEANSEMQQAIMKGIEARTNAIMTGDIDPETGEPNAPRLEEIANKFKTEYANPVEIASNQLIKFLVHNDNLRMKFSQGWEHALISAEELYYVGIHRGHVTTRVCNPLNVSFSRDEDNPFVHKGQWAVEERWVPVGTIIDEYGDEISDDLMKRLDEGELGGKLPITMNGQQPGFAYDFNGGMKMDGSRTSNTSNVYVANVAWRAYKKIGYLTYLDDRTGKPEKTVVDETFKMTPELKESGAEVTWDWITEIWEGTQIGDKDFVGVRPLENQTGNLPYVGYIYNNVNSKATSVVDMAKAHQYTYLIVWWRLEQELAKAKGKKFLMDLAQLPQSKGWTVDQWMHYFDNMGVAWINSKEEGRQGDPTSTAAFNQFKEIDMTLSKSVGQYMDILRKLEEQIENITGVSRQREGNIGASETASGAHRAIIQSTNNTKPLFFYHDQVRKIVLQECLELCRVAYVDGLELQFAVSDTVTETLKLEPGQLIGTDLAVFVVDSFEEAENIDKLERFLEIAIQTDKANLSDAIEVIESKSMSQIKDTIVAGERAKIQRDQEAAEQANNVQREISQNELADKEAERELKRYEIDTKASTDIETALISAEASTADLTDHAKAMEERKTRLAERKLELDSDKIKKELALKDEALEETKRSNKSKESIARSSKQKANAEEN